MTTRSVDMIISFRFGDVFPPDDVTSEWVATLALAFNDIAFVHDQFDEAYERQAYHYFYLLRLAVSHFNEAAKYLDETAAIPEIQAFVSGLQADVRALYDDCLRRYHERRGFLEQVRSLSAFHYPKLRVVSGSRRPRVMQAILRDIEDETGSFFKPASGTIRGSRALYADDIASRLFSLGAKDDDDLIAHHTEVKEATTSFMRFVNAALDEWFARAVSRGTDLTKRPGSPPSYASLLEQAGLLTGLDDTAK